MVFVVNRILRFGLLFVGCCFVIILAGYTNSGQNTESYPITVRVWLNDSFVGGVGPAIHGTTPDAILYSLAAGNDLVYVTPDAPRCPVLSTAWVTPVPGTTPNAQIYNATIQCDDTPRNTIQTLLVQVGP